MRGIRFVPSDVNVAFISKRKWLFAFSLFLTIGAMGMFAFKSINYGIDFTGGVLIEMRTPESADIVDLRGKLSELGLGEVSLQGFGAPNDVMIRLQKQEGGERAQQAAIDKVKEALGAGIEYRRIEVVGPLVSKDLFWGGVWAVALANLAILAYVWFRFEWQFGVCAIISLLHDVLATIGLFSLLWLEFNLTSIAAILTITGYSINDTVVVFDRVRENMRKYKTMPLPELLNRSINETLSRTMITGVTTLLALLSLIVFGGEVISSFSIAMFWGVVIGTYSSVYIAVPLLLYMNLRHGAAKNEQKQKEAAIEQTP